jgi:hypothetical protein
MMSKSMQALTDAIRDLPGDCFQLGFAYWILAQVDWGKMSRDEALPLLSRLMATTTNQENAAVFRRIFDEIDGARGSLPVLPPPRIKSDSRCNSCDDEVCPKSRARARRHGDRQVLKRVTKSPTAA